MPAADLCGEFWAEQSQFLTPWRSHMRRETSSGVSSPTHRSEQNQLWKFGGCQPGEPTAIVNPTKRQAPVAVKTVPAKLGFLESFATHGLHGVPEQRRYLSDLDRHVRSRPPYQLPSAAGGSGLLNPSILTLSFE
jgi:hypothetical protein